MLRKKKIALVLGSGSARGWAHLGVIRALEEAEIPIHCVVGTSIGALVGGSFASRKHNILQEVVLRLDWRQLAYLFLDPTFPHSGLIDGSHVEQFAREHVQEVNIEDLPISFCAVATDILTGQGVVIDRGDLVEAIRASLAIAGIFTPVCRGDAVLVDGGIVEPLPISVARRMGADYVIASELNLLAFDARLRAMSDRLPERPDDPDVNDEPRHIKDTILQRVDQMLKKWDPTRLAGRLWFDGEPTPNIFEIVQNARHILEAQVTRSRIKADPPDLLIQPPVGHLSSMDYHRAGEAIKEGYRETIKQIESLGRLTRRQLSP